MDTESRTIRRVFWRLIPFLILCYFIAYLDRVNVSFAALSMNKDLGLSNTAYGFGAGIFFVSYFLFEVPSNFLLERVGARRWIARIMLSWGLISGGMAFVSGEMSFYVMRFLLGMAEAGFFPGIIFYLGLWFPSSYRGRIVTTFMIAIPLSGMIGSPLSSLLLGLDGTGGLRGWQWLYIVEGAPAIALSILVFFYLTDRPAEAGWLGREERDWLVTRMQSEQHLPYARSQGGVMTALADPIVLKLSVVYFALAAMNYGFSFYAPQFLQAFGVSDRNVGPLLIIPSLAGAIGMVLWGRHSDATGERRWHLALAALCSIAGLVGAALSRDVYSTMIWLTLVGFGVNAATVFWTIPAGFLTGASAAAGIAAISSIGQFAGFVAPYAIGYLKDATQAFASGLIAVAATGLIGIVVLVLLIPTARTKHVS